jgi:hypothetical protein
MRRGHTSLQVTRGIRWFTVRRGVEAAVTTDPLVALLTRMALILRGSVAVFGTAAALLTLDAAPNPAATIVALIGFDAVTVAYVLLARRVGLGSPVVVADVAAAAVLVLAMRWVAPPDLAAITAGWVFTAVSIVLIVAQLGGRPQWTVPAAACLVVAFGIGAWLAAAPGGAASTFTLAIQLAITAAFVAVLRRAGRRAQEAAHEYHETVRAQEAARLRRDAERTELTLLHNGPLTTLTLVAQGGLSTETVAAVRAQAAVDLAVLGAEAGPPAPGEAVQLADLLERTVAIIRHRLDVRLTTAQVALPAAAAQSLAGAVAEALENVARHAGTDAATVHTSSDGGRVTISIADDGRGFDPTRVPVGKFGLRESITGQLKRAGGCAEIASRPRAGTTITLVWPA